MAKIKRSYGKFLILLFCLSLPCWVLGGIYDVQIFPGLKLFQLPLAMPMVAALILVYSEAGKDGVLALLKRTFDYRKFKPLIWLLPVLFVYPSIGLLNNWLQSFSGISIPPPHFSFSVFLVYCTVFFMTYGEEIGLTGYALDPMQERYSALRSGIYLGLVWAGYHIPGFVISGYYSFAWICWQALYIVATRVLFVWVYNNSGKSLFSMALFHWTFGLFWSFWPQDNLQKAVPFYDPRLCAFLAVGYVLLVVYLWGYRTLATYRFARTLKYQ
jgi:membrane protease YdiL (CAAX protease family)